ncbi:MAG TPA: hypothetical protein VI112_09630 [Bacteroidia bacterium]|jgi:hypothetical protein
MGFFCLALFALAFNEHDTTCNGTANSLKEFGLHGRVKSVSESSYRAVDSSGTPVKGEPTDPGIGKKYFTLQFNDAGYLVLEMREGRYQFLYSYDKQWRLLEEKAVNNHGTVIDRWTYKYGSDCEKLSATVYMKEGTIPERTWSYVYGRTDSTSTAIEYRADGALSKRMVYHFNKNGQVVKEEWYDDKGMVNTMVNEYDAAGNKISFCRYMPGGSLNEKKVFAYKFDERGNWVQCITFSNGLPQYFIERTYVYY